jgi:hypothetical protein
MGPLGKLHSNSVFTYELEHFILWRRDQLLGKELEINEIKVTAMEQRLKHTSTIIQVLLGTGFSMWSVPRSYLEENLRDQLVVARVEAGSNTSTVTLRVVRGDEMGSLKSETVKYGRESQGTRNRERMRWEGPAAYTKDRPLVREGAPQKQDRNCQIVIAKYLVMSPRWGSTPRLTDWLTVSRNVTLTLTLFRIRSD